MSPLKGLGIEGAAYPALRPLTSFADSILGYIRAVPPMKPDGTKQLIVTKIL